ncbi:hypothetical protein B566_EDAN013363 [Ephemera danica]|nr:hypothetical protein B566_EDAN013363 [Ephemera danica]
MPPCPHPGAAAPARSAEESYSTTHDDVQPDSVEFSPQSQQNVPTSVNNLEAAWNCKLFYSSIHIKKQAILFISHVGTAMSGGSGADRRGGKRAGGRAQGWEEAGAEFYQESYPGGAAGCSDADLDAALHKDAAHLATMLPSKQVQHTIARAKQATRKRTSTRSKYNTIRRGSTTNDVHVSMLPDFTENFPNEERTWEEIMQIKAMPVSMAQKRELKAKLQSATKLRLQGLEQLKWQRRKFWQQFKSNWKEFYSKLELWQGSLKTIEGNFGIGVVAYFLFIKWLMFLNMVIFLLLFVLVVLPTILLQESPQGQCVTEENITATVECCSEEYANETLSIASNNTATIILDFIQGTGWMENTLLFYGFYSLDIYTLSEAHNLYYDLPLAFVASTVLYFLISLIAIVKSSARGFKERLVEGEGQFYQYCNLIFGGWDFCIDNEKGAGNKHKALFNEIKGYLEAERLDEEKQNRSRQEKVRLFFLRLVVNLVIFLVLCGAGTLIYHTFYWSIELLASVDSYNDPNVKKFLNLLYEYLPYLAIVSLNLLVPFLFSFLVNFEHYSPMFVVKITLMRTVLLRLASLGVLAASIYQLVSCSDGGGLLECTCKQNGPLCWETYVGQQFYKLAILDAVMGVAVTFFINFPRALIARHAQNSTVVKFICEQQFELPRHVLDIVYSQTVYWIGSFYAPLLPALGFINCFLMFYVKKFACLVNSTPSSTVYRASRSNSLFMAVLLVSFVVAAIVVGYSLAEVVPSRSCGPFRGRLYVWEIVITAFEKLPSWFQDFAHFLSTAGFAVPVIVVLLLALYYYSAVTSANRHMVVVLRQQLVLEGHDKQFLLSRLSTIIKQQQERLKPRRQSAGPDISVATDISDNS